MFQKRILQLFLFLLLPFHLLAVQVDTSLVRILKMDGDTERINALIQMAQKRKASEPIIALAISNIAIKELQRRKELKSQAELYLIKAQIFENLGLYNSAFKYNYKGYGIAKVFNSYQNQATALRQIGNLFSNTSQVETAMFFNIKGLQLCKKYRLLKEYSSCLNNLGLDYKALSNYRLALLCFLQSLEIKKRIGEKKNIINTYGLIGLAYMYMGNFNKAYDNFYQGLMLSYLNNDLQGVSICNGYLSEFFFHIGDNKKSMKYVYRSMVLREKMKLKLGLAENYVLLVSLFESAGKDSLSLHYFYKALKEYKTIPNPQGQATLYSKMATFFLNRNFLDSSLFYQKLTTGIDKKLKMNNWISEDYLMLSKINLAKKNISVTEKYLDSAFYVLRNFPNLIISAECLKFKSDFLEREYHLKESLSYFKKYIKVRDAISNLAKKESIILKDSKIEFEKKLISDSIKYKNLQFAHDSKIHLQNQKIYGQIIKQYTLITILIILIGIAWFLRVRYRILQDSIVSERKLMQNERHWSIVEERKKISTYMHEDVGSALTNLLFQIRIKEWKQRDLIQNNLVSMRNTTFDLIDKIDQIVWSLNLQKDTLRGLITFLSSYFQETLKDFQISAKTEIPNDLPNTPINQYLRKDILLAMKESINNALKHAQANEMTLKVNYNDTFLVLILEDNGCGFDTTLPNIGNGMITRKKRVEKYNGTFEIISWKGKGTLVKLCFGIKNIENL